jgi:hypothetical protein
VRLCGGVGHGVVVKKGGCLVVFCLAKFEVVIASLMLEVAEADKGFEGRA